jgi:hypothetical protein
MDLFIILLNALKWFTVYQTSLAFVLDLRSLLFQL